MSRLRLGYVGAIPLGAQTVALTPFPTVNHHGDGTPATNSTMLVGFDGYANPYFPVVCGLQGQRLNKVFLARDAQKGPADLNGRDPDLLYTVAGGIASNCSAIAFVAQGVQALPALVHKLQQ